jgi:hypothetical protein
VTSTERGADYRLRISRAISASTRKPCTTLTLTTEKKFTSFRYVLDIEEARDGAQVSLRVRGLQAPSLTIPRSGPAEFTREYDDLVGECIISVTVLDGRVARVRCTIDDTTVRLLDPVDNGPLIVELPH